MSVVLTDLERAVVDAEIAFAPVLGALIRSDDPTYIACLLAVSKLRSALRPEVRRAHPVPRHPDHDKPLPDGCGVVRTPPQPLEEEVPPTGPPPPPPQDPGPIGS
jgi:hypothetical protein